MKQNKLYASITTLLISITTCNASQQSDIPSLVYLASEAVHCGYIDPEDIQSCEHDPRKAIIEFARTGDLYLAALIDQAQIPNFNKLISAHQKFNEAYQGTRWGEKIKKDNPNIIRKFIQWSKQKCNPAEPISFQLLWALLSAADQDQIKTLNFLLNEQKIWVDNQPYNNNDTALIRGARHPRIVQILLSHKAYHWHFNDDRERPLMMAALHNAKESVRMLLAAGAKVNAKSKLRLTALDYADVFVTSKHNQPLTEEESTTYYEICTLLQATGGKRGREF